MAVQKEWFDTDYYEVLGVTKDADTKEITKAYRAIAKKNHPDTNPNDEKAAEIFKQATTAYDVLSNEENRKEYDHIRMMTAEGSQAGVPGGFGFNFQTVNPNFTNASEAGDDLSDLLGGLFSRMRKPAPGAQQDFGYEAQPQSLDIETQTNLSFYQALEGSIAKVSYQLPSQAPQEIKVKIPAGVNDGQRIKVSGKGISAGGRTGDLYVVVKVGTHPWFTRKGRTLLITVPISYAESILGTQVRVPTLDKPVTVKVPEMTSSGKTLRVKGRGCTIGEETGDLLVTFEIVTPKEVSETEKQLLKELINNQLEHPRSKFGLENN